MEYRVVYTILSKWLIIQIANQITALRSFVVIQHFSCQTVCDIQTSFFGLFLRLRCCCGTCHLDTRYSKNKVLFGLFPRSQPVISKNLSAGSGSSTNNFANFERSSINKTSLYLYKGILFYPLVLVTHLSFVFMSMIMTCWLSDFYGYI